MNSSFSKKRHIQESNIIIEKRLLIEKDIPSNDYEGVAPKELLKSYGFKYSAKRNENGIGQFTLYYLSDNLPYFWDPETQQLKRYYTPEQRIRLEKQRAQLEKEKTLGWTDEKKNLYACVYKHPNKSNISQAGNFSIDGVAYYPNGRWYFQGIGSGSYTCNGNQINRNAVDKPEGQKTASTQGSVESPPTMNTISKIKQKTTPKIIHKLESGAQTLKGDPYQYKVGPDNEWQVKSYKESNKILNNWVSLKGNQTATTYLDSKLPGRRNVVNPTDQQTTSQRQIDTIEKIPTRQPQQLNPTSSNIPQLKIPSNVSDKDRRKKRK